MASRRRISHVSDNPVNTDNPMGIDLDNDINAQLDAMATDESVYVDTDSVNPNEVPNTDTAERSTGVRGTLSKEGYEKLERYEAVTGLSRSDLLDLAVKTLDTVDVDYLMVLIRNLNDSKVSTIERMLRSR